MHRWSKLFIPTLREAPADAEVASHQILLRAGYVRQLGAGIYNYLPLATRSINKIVAIVREEMDHIGQEFLLPALNTREIWEESGRWTGMGENMFRLKDRKGADLCLGMTHEEVMTSIARNEIRSYKQLPQIWYQIQTKFRDEPRPKAGLLRVRQFTMKDSYSFDIDQAGLDLSYDLHDAAYRAIFTRCGLEFVAVDADSGAMGGSKSQEFMVYTDAGEDWIASSPDGSYAANIEKATSTLSPVTDLEPTGDGMPELIHTPAKHTIDEVGAFLGVEKVHQIKTMAYLAAFDGTNGSAGIPIVVLLRGDHTLNETKLGAVVGSSDLGMIGLGEDIQEIFGSPSGSLGPVGLNAISLETLNFVRQRGILPKEIAGDGGRVMYRSQDSKQAVTYYYKNPVVIIDSALEGRENLVAGANKDGFHLWNVTPGRDFKGTKIADVRNVAAGEPDPITGQPLRLGKAVEIGHIFKLGDRYTQSMHARVLDRNGKEVTPIMGCYGIGIERILTAAMEQSAAKLGKSDRGEFRCVLPLAIAPYEVVVTVTKQTDTVLAEAGEKIAADLEKAGWDVLLDDRNDSAGVKFKDADLIGTPYRVTVGKRLVEGFVEIIDRLRGTTEEVAAADVVHALNSAKDASKQ